MRAKSLVLILIALGCGLVASIGISQVMERNAKSGGPAVETLRLYVAAKDIDLNDKLVSENVKLEDWPAAKVPEGAISKLEEVTGHYALTRLYAGEPILKTKLTTEIVASSQRIPEGYRAFSLPVKTDMVVGGLVKPGDRVDIIGFFREGPGVPRTATKKILTNVRIFAVNAETEQSVDSSGQSMMIKTVSVLVKQDQIEPLMLAKQLGVLSLSLRHPKEEETAATAGKGEASVEELFGTRPQQADDPGKSGSGAGAAVGRGLLSLLEEMRSRPGQSGTANAINTLASSSKVAWEMELLTPAGSTHLVWHDPTQLPTIAGPSGDMNQSTGGAQPNNAAPTTTPGNGSATGSAAGAGGAAGATGGSAGATGGSAPGSAAAGNGDASAGPGAPASSAASSSDDAATGSDN